MMTALRTTAVVAVFLTMFTLAKSDSIAVGADAPAVVGTTETGASLNFAEVYKKGYTLVYFFPKADTPGCTAQGCSLRDAYEELTKRGVTVIGVSTDKVEDQRSFKAQYRLPFTLIADTEKKVIHAFGQSGVIFASRQAFLIDKNGKVVWRDLRASTKKQAEDVLAALQQLGG